MEQTVKVHYTGYSKDYDEWKDMEDIEDVMGDESPDQLISFIYAPYSLYKDLSVRIKRSLTCARASPDTKIAMPFDTLSFNGGLKSAGTPSRKQGGVQHYKIKSYEDLSELLGSNWHVRGINCNGDYGYVIRDSRFLFKKV